MSGLLAGHSQVKVIPGKTLKAPWSTSDAEAPEKLDTGLGPLNAGVIDDIIRTMHMISWTRAPLQAITYQD